MKLPLRLFSLIVSFLTLFITISCSQTNKPDNPNSNFKTISNAEWKKRLTPEQYYILREKGTERAFTGKYWNHHEQGIYHCAACDLPLFDSKTKFESGSGWPSFYQPLTKTSIALEKDTSFGMVRDEVVCHRCGGHLGHVFEDGPAPTGLRYCLNSEALSFHKKEK